MREISNKPLGAASVLIVSCDRYSDLWEPFFKCFFKYWPDCPYPVYLGSNWRSYDNPRVTTVNVGDDKSYSENLRSMLTVIPSQWVVCWVEDLMPSSPVDTAQLIEWISNAQAANADYLKLLPEHPLAYHERIKPAAIQPGMPYRVSMTVALWNSATLQHLLRDGESAWEFEKSGSRRSAQYGGLFLGLPPLRKSKAPLQHEHVIVKGKIKLTSRAFLEREQLWQEIRKTRKLESLRSHWYGRCYAAVFAIVWRGLAYLLMRRARRRGRKMTR